MKIAVVEIGAGIVMLAIALIALSEAVQLPPSMNPMDIGPAAFPYLIIGGIIVCSLVLIVKAYRKHSQGDEEKVTIVRANMVVVSIVILIVYAILIPILGYYLSTALAMIGLLLSSGQKRLIKLVFVTGGFLLFAWIGFENILGVPLP